MKSIVIISLTGILLFPHLNYAQVDDSWKVNGNNASSNYFIGTTNSEGLNFRTNNQNRLQILPNGQLRFNSFALGNTGLLTYDATGLLTPLTFDGNGDMVLSNSGSFIPASSFSNWSLNGNFLYTQNHYVGIGTSTPTAPLTVAGDALFTGSITTSGLNVLQKIEADTIKGAIRLDVNGNLMLGEEGGYNGITSRQEELRINSRPGFDHNVVINANTNGNLGIGVVNPQEKFDLFGNARLTGDVIFSSYAQADTISRLLSVDADGKTKTMDLSDLQKVFYSQIGPQPLDCFAGYEPTWINGPGKIYTGHLTGDNCQAYVGIGTSEPESRLHVVGSTRSSRLHVGIFDLNDDAVTLSAFRSGTSSSPSSIVTFGRRLAQQSQDVTYFDLKMDGSLRLSNDAREYFLLSASDETAYARRIVVNEENWADYVFKNDYELMPIPDVEAFIAKNGHLPNVPSAAVIEENGVDLGEMAKITMEKVEELTLYIIQQQELLDTQQKTLQLQFEMLEAQQKEIERLKAGK